MYQVKILLLIKNVNHLHQQQQVVLIYNLKLILIKIFVQVLQMNVIMILLLQNVLYQHLIHMLVIQKD